MALLSIVLLIVFIIAAILLILVVLIQDDQGEGLSGMFGGGSATAFGSRTGNVLTRFTTVVGAIFLFGALAMAWLNRTPESSDLLRKARIERIQETEKKDWWVETGPGGSQPAAPAGGEATSPVPSTEDTGARKP